MEEMRYRHYQLTVSGKQQQVVVEAQELIHTAERQIWTVLNDIDGAIKYIIDGEKQHPNRLDVVKQRGVPTLQLQSGSNNFSTAFGQIPPSSKQVSVSAPSHAAPASLVRPSTSSGQPAAPISSFGQPSSLGLPKTTFGQPSSLGPPKLLFGHAPSSGSEITQPAKESPFGQVQGRFPVGSGATSEPVRAPVSGFAQPSNPFGQNAPQMPHNHFSHQSTFGKPASSSSTFEKPILQQAVGTSGAPAIVKSNLFMSAESNPRTALPGSSTQSSNRAGKAAQFSQAAANGSSLLTDAKRDAQGKLVTWRGNSVQYVDNEACYRETDGRWRKIWFPDGAPVYAKAVELPDDMYDEKTKESYRYLREHGTFKGDLLPELPPKKEWCNWNF